VKARELTLAPLPSPMVHSFSANAQRALLGSVWKAGEFSRSDQQRDRDNDERDDERDPSNFVPIRNATRKTADPNILKGCRLAVPPSIHALRRTPAPTSLEMSLAAGGACHHRDRVREINDGMSAFEAKADMRW